MADDDYKLLWWPADCTNYLRETGHLAPETCLEGLRPISLFFWSPSLTFSSTGKRVKQEQSCLIYCSSSTHAGELTGLPVDHSDPTPQCGCPPCTTSVLPADPGLSTARTLEPQKGIPKCCHRTRCFMYSLFPKLLKSPFWKTASC